MFIKYLMLIASRLWIFLHTMESIVTLGSGLA